MLSQKGFLHFAAKEFSLVPLYVAKEGNKGKIVTFP
jgi:hypothetical protein